MQWNPDAPKLVGPQYPLRNVPETTSRIGGPAIAVDGQAMGVAQRMPSTASETVYAVHGGIGGFLANGSAALVEVIPTGSEEPGSVSVSEFVPNASQTASGYWMTFNDGPIWQAIDGDQILTYEYAWITNEYGHGLGPTLPLGATFDVKFNTAGVLAGRRILDVQLNFASAIDSSYGQQEPRFYGDFSVFGRSWAGVANGGKGFPTSRIGGYVINSMNSGEINRATMQPWTVANLQALASGYSVTVGAYLPADPYGGGFAYYIYKLWLTVTHCAETRKHTSLMTAGLTFPEYLPFIEGARTPTGGSTFSKTNGQALTALLRQPTIGNIGDFPFSPRFGVPYLTGWADNPVAGLEFHPQVPLNQYGFPIYGTGLGPVVKSDLMTFGFVVDAADPSSTSVDSQPYFNARPVEVVGTVQQEFSGATATDDYSALAVALYYSGSPDDLVLTLKKRSDDTVMGIATISTDDADGSVEDDLSMIWHVVTAEFPAPITLAAATTYYVDCTSGGSGAWYIQALSASSPSQEDFIAVGMGTYGGTTLQATEGGVDFPGDDLLILLVVPVPPPTDAAGEPVGCE